MSRVVWVVSMMMAVGCSRKPSPFAEPTPAPAVVVVAADVTPAPVTEVKSLAAIVLPATVAPSPRVVVPVAPTPREPTPVAVGRPEQPAEVVPMPLLVANPGNTVVTEADMNDVHLLIDTASMVGGRMPSPRWVRAALQASGSPAGKLVAAGVVIPTGATARETLWAVEYKAAVAGGWVVTHTGPEQMSAAEVRRRLAAQR